MKLPGWWRRHFLLVEAVISLVVTAGFAAWAWRCDGWYQLDVLFAGVRPTFYQTLAAIFGSLFGFVLAAVAIVLGFTESDRFKVLRESDHYSDLWRIFKETIRSLGIATLAAVVALIVDRDDAPSRIAGLAVVLTSVYTILRLARCVWVLEMVVSIVVSKQRNLHPESHVDVTGDE